MGHSSSEPSGDEPNAPLFSDLDTGIGDDAAAATSAEQISTDSWAKMPSDAEVTEAELLLAAVRPRHGETPGDMRERLLPELQRRIGQELLSDVKVPAEPTATSR